MDLSIWLDVILPLYLRHIELMAQTLFWWDAPTMAFQQLGWCSVPIWVVTSPVLKCWILVRGSKAAGLAKLESGKVFKPTGPFQPGINSTITSPNISSCTLATEHWQVHSQDWKILKTYEVQVRNPLKPRYWSWRWKLGLLRASRHLREPL